MGTSSNTQSLSALGTTTPVPIMQQASPGLLPPTVVVNLSAGASLMYSVEMTGDNVLVPNYQAASGNWGGLTDLTGQTTSGSSALGGAVSAVRLHVTQYTSGTATIQVIQPNPITGL